MNSSSIDSTEISETLWESRTPVEAMEALQGLQCAILNQTFNVDNVSDTFRSIQSAASRFRKNITLQEKVLWVCATLAKVIIAPAWWIQREFRARMELHHHADNPSNGDTHHVPVLHIPEALPTAMIQFVAKIHAESCTMAQAQIVLVRAICCPDEGVNLTTEQWTIPNVDEDIQSMVLAWLRLASNAGNWEFVLTTTKACADLLSAGWQPKETDGLVEKLLEIGLCSCLISQETSIQEQLAASASLAEAVATLVILSAESLIPIDLVQLVTRVACQLYVKLASAKRKENSTMHSTSDESMVEQQHESLEAQRQSAFSDISLLLWFLLANATCSERSIHMLLQLIEESDPRSPIYRIVPESIQECETTCMQAGAAIRVASTALWGKPPDILCVPLLRVYWKPFLEVIHRLLLNIYVLINGSYVSNSSTMYDLCALAIEALIALGRALEQEIRATPETLSCIEWDIIVNCIESGILPWLRTQLDPNLPDVNATVRSFLCLLAEFLDKSIDVDDHIEIELESQKRLYLLLLRSGLSFLNAEESNRLGKSAIGAWVKFSLFPSRLEGWTTAASDILGEIFRYSENDALYAYSPRLRLQALVTLTHDAESEDDMDENQNSKIPSLLEMTQQMREQHLSFINDSLLPAITKILFTPEVERKTSYLPLAEDLLDMETKDELISIPYLAQILSDAVNPPISTLVDTSALKQYTVHLVGRLYRGFTGHRNLRSFFINLLKAVALNESHSMMVEDSSRLIRHAIPVRISAVIELEKCLSAPFTILPHAHESVPLIIEALCSVFDEYTKNYSRADRFSYDMKQMTCLAVAALDPLTRLRVAIDMHVAYRKQTYRNFHVFLMKFLSTGVLDSYSAAAESEGSPLLVFEGIADNVSKTRRTVISFQPIIQSCLSFLRRSVAYTSKEALAPEFIYVRRRVRIACYDAVRTIALITPKIFQCDIWVGLSLTFGKDHGSEILESEELFAAGRAQAKCLQNAFISESEAYYTQTRAKQNCFLQSKILLRAVCRLNNMSSVDDLSAFSRALCAVLPSICSLEDNDTRQDMIDTIFSTLTRLMDIEQASWRSAEHHFNPERIRCLSALLGVLHDLLLLCTHNEVSEGSACHWFLFCVQLIRNYPNDIEDSALNLAIRCFMTLTDCLGLAQLEEASAALSRQEIALRDVKEKSSLHHIISKVMAERRRILTGGCLPMRHGDFVSKIRIYSLETMCSYNFVTERDISSGLQQGATWLHCDGAIFTIRIGSAKSRYRGFVELAIRSVTSRRRKLIEIPGEAIITSPESHALSPSAFKERGRFSGNASSRNEHFSSFGVSDMIKTKAEEVMLRFDSFVVEDSGNSFSFKRFNDRTDFGLYNLDDKACDSSIETFVDSICPGNYERAFRIKKGISALLGGEPELAVLSTEQWTPLGRSKELERSITILDRVPILNTHKIALIYDRSEITEETGEYAVLSTMNCSPSFHRFICALGTLTPTQYLNFFSGGLDVTPYQSDGEYTVAWIDENTTKSMAATTIVVFHVLNLMPENLLGRKRHVGNDNVLIIFSDKGSKTLMDYDLADRDLSESLIGGAFAFASIFVTIVQKEMTRVAIRVKRELPGILKECLFPFVSDNIVSEKDAPVFVRNVAIKIDLICRSVVETTDPPTPSLVRYDQLQNMKRYQI